MRKKLGLFWFAAALLGAALIFSGCETEAETETKYVAGEMIYLDVLVTTEATLRTELLKAGDLAIGLNGAATLTADLEIPDGKLVYILNGGTLATTASYDLTVKGVVYVGIGGILDVSAGNVVVDGGSVSVLPVKSAAAITAGVPPGTLKVVNADSVNDGEATAKTVLGTDKVWIGGALQYATGAAAFADADAFKTAFGYVSSGGTLDISAATATGSTPSTLAATATLYSGKNLIATAAADEAAATTTLSIPANANITALATDTLEAVTTLTVNGTFTTDAGTLEAVTALTVNGTLTASAATGATAGIAITVGAGGKATLGGTIAVLKASSVAAGGELTTGTVTAFGTTPAATLTAAAGSTVNGFLFPADATITGLGEDAVTISALTIPATTTLTVAEDATLTVAAGGNLTFTNNTSKVVLLAGASLEAAATTSVLASKGTTTADGSGISLTVTASSDLAAPTGYKSDTPAANATITLTTDTAGTQTAAAYVIGNASFLIAGLSSNAHSVAPVVSTAAATSAAIGGIKAGASSAVILVGST
jgi:hypothetical protein